MDNEHVETTGEDLIAALEIFGQTSYAVVGLENSIMAVKFLTGLMQTSPGMYQKLVQPETIEKLQSLAASKKKLGPVELVGLIGDFKEIFAS